MKHLFREVADLSTTGEETLLSVSEYFGVKPRSEVVADGDLLSRADTFVGYKRVCVNDLAMNIMLAWKTGLGFSSFNGIVSPAYSVFRLIDGSCNPWYFDYLLRSRPAVTEFHRWSYGIMDSRLRLYPNVFMSLTLPVPPLPVQEAIAALLDTETARIDALIDRKRCFIDLLLEKRAALITHAVTKGLDSKAELKDSGVDSLGMIPSCFDVRPFGKVATLQRGFDLPADSREPGPYPVVSSGGIVDAHAVGPISPPGVVTGRYGSVGSVYWIDTAYWPHNTALYVRDFWGNEPRFVYWLLLSLAAGITAAESGKSAVPGLDQKDTRGLRVARPPIEYQHRIADYLDAETAKIDALVDKTRQSIDLLREHRTALISAAVTGKIDVAAKAV